MSFVYSQKENLSTSFFIKRRLTRILPLYWLAFILTLLAVVFIKDAGPKGLVIIVHALGLQSWYPGYVLDLNFTTWSISVEFVFYALFPLLLNLIKNWNNSKLLTGALLLWVLQSIQHFCFVNYLSDGSKKVEEFISAFPVWHLPTFFVGMAVARFALYAPERNLIRRFPLLSVLISVLGFLYIVYLPNPFLKYIHNGLLAPLYILLVLGLFFDRSALSRFLSTSYLSRLGDLSYGLFIFQYPLWLVCNKISSPQFATSTAFFYIYLFSVMTVSYLLNRFFEVPVRKYLRGE